MKNLKNKLIMGAFIASLIISPTIGCFKKPNSPERKSERTHLTSKSKKNLENISYISPSTIIDFYTLTPWKFRGELFPKRFNKTPSTVGLKFKNYSIKSAQDDIKIDSWFIPGEIKDKAVVICHSNDGAKADMLKYTKFLNNEGYPIFMFDFRGQGNSEGKYVTYGAKEQYDLEAAINHLKKEKGIEKIAVYGQRMGAATALIEASKEKNINLIISDSVWKDVPNITSNYAKRLGYDIPNSLASPITFGIHLLSFFKTGANYSELNIGKRLNKINNIPILFIHNKKDPLYPFENSVQLHKQYNGPKDILLENYNRKLLNPSHTLKKKVTRFLKKHF